MRRTSVGWAVTTGHTSAPASSRATTSAVEVGLVEQLERGGEAARCGGEPSRRWNRRRRSWCMSSARLASSEKWLNARMTWLAERMSSPASRFGQLRAVGLRPADPERLDAGGLDQVEDVVRRPARRSPRRGRAPADGCRRAGVRRRRGPRPVGPPERRRSATSTVASDTGAVSGPRVTGSCRWSAPEALRVWRAVSPWPDQPCSSSRRASAASWSPAAAPRRNCSTAPSKSPRSASSTARLWWQYASPAAIPPR